MRIVLSVAALIIVYTLLRWTELYVPRTLDSDWKYTRNDATRKADPFNVCSPESFGDCAKTKFPHLSRY
jgi:hypothetical protein